MSLSDLNTTRVTHSALCLSAVPHTVSPHEGRIISLWCWESNRDRMERLIWMYHSSETWQIWTASCHRLWWSLWKCWHRNSELGTAAKMGLKISSKRFPATTRISCMSRMTLNVDNQHVYVHHKCQVSTVLQCTLENIFENSYKRGAKRNNFLRSESLIYVLKDIWINLGIDTDSHNCLWFLVWCDWGPSSWSMRCSPQKKTFVWLTKTYPKEEKFNKLNWLPLFYREQTLTRKKSCQKSCPTGKKMRLSRKKRIW